MEDINEMTLDELYYILLLSNKYGDEIPYDMDMVWNNIRTYYYLENNIYMDDKSILFEWIKNKARYPLLDTLMLQVLDKFINQNNIINKVDPFFISNVKKMRDIISNYGKKISNNNQDIKLSKMKRTEVIDTVKDILSEIDPTLEWLEIYEAAMDNIIYIDMLNDERKQTLEELMGINLSKGDNNACIFLNDKQEGYIFLNYTGTISDVVTTIHEVTHYISRYKNNWVEEMPILREFSAIFFELYAIGYLKRMGYKDNELKAINQDRLSDMVRLFDDAMLINDYLIMLIENGAVKEEYDNNIDKYERVDRCTNTLIDNPYLLHDYYPYMLGNYLATKGIDRVNNDKYLLSIIKYITDNLSKMKANDIFDLVGCGDNAFIEYDSICLRKNLKKEKK